MPADNKKKYAAREIHICPECGYTNFRVSIQICQGWLVDTGDFVKVKEDREQVLHRPSGSEIWECTECHLVKKGDEFLYPLYEDSIVKYNLRTIAEALVGEIGENCFRAVQLLVSNDADSCGLFVSANQEVKDGKSWYSIHINDCINDDAYIADTENASVEAILKTLDGVFETAFEKYLEKKRKERFQLQISRSQHVKLFQKLIEAFPEAGSDEAEHSVFCQNGYEILSMSQHALNAIEAVFVEQGYMETKTGYYDADEDIRNDEVNRNTGFWYLTI